MQEQRDEKLWAIAVKRAKFRKSLYTYVVTNTFFWVLWWFTTGRIAGFRGIPWPIWPMLGWGIALAYQYYEAYQSDQSDMAEKEYEKLKRQE